MGGKQHSENTLKEGSQLHVNPLYESLMPRLSQDEYDALKNSIKAEGQFVPIIVNSQGVILDGHHRYRACLEVGVDPEFDVKNFSDPDAEKDFVIRVNWARRQLSREQQKELALLLRQDGWSQPKVSELLNVSQGTISNWESNIKNIKNDNANDPKFDLRYSVPSSVKEQIYEAFSAGQTQRDIADNFKISQPRVSQIVRQVEARKKVPEPPTITPFPSKRYRTIVIDPPWPIEKIEREVRPNQGKELDYPVMSLREIGNLPILNLSDLSGCHVYLWTTAKFLPVALQIFAKWGLNYQCVLVWVKNVGITPFSFMYNLEFVLFGKLGSLPLAECGVKQSFEGSEGFKADSNRHSEKPDSFYEVVSRVSPEPRLDMFARKNREGFDVWGNEVNSA